MLNSSHSQERRSDCEACRWVNCQSHFCKVLGDWWHLESNLDLVIDCLKEIAELCDEPFVSEL